MYIYNNFLLLLTYHAEN